VQQPRIQPEEEPHRPSLGQAHVPREREPDDHHQLGGRAGATHPLGDRHSQHPAQHVRQRLHRRADADCLLGSGLPTGATTTAEEAAEEDLTNEETDQCVQLGDHTEPADQADDTDEDAEQADEDADLGPFRRYLDGDDAMPDTTNDAAEQ